MSAKTATATRTAKSAASPATTLPAIAAELGADEKLLWSSRPGLGAYTFAHLGGLLMGLAIAALAVVWHAVVRQAGMMPELALAAWGFAGLALAYAVLPVVAAIKGKWFVLYALTSRRLLIIELFPRHRVRAFPYKAVTQAVTKGVRKGNGTLLIDAPGAASRNPVTPRAGFYGVAHVAKVAEAVHTLRDPQAALARRAQTANAAPVPAAALRPAVTAPRAGDDASRFLPSAATVASAGPRARPAIHTRY